jgi:hypothetical protein
MTDEHGFAYASDFAKDTGLDLGHVVELSLEIVFSQCNHDDTISKFLCN